MVGQGKKLPDAPELYRRDCDMHRSSALGSIGGLDAKIEIDGGWQNYGQDRGRAIARKACEWMNLCCWIMNRRGSQS